MVHLTEHLSIFFDAGESAKLSVTRSGKLSWNEKPNIVDNERWLPGPGLQLWGPRRNENWRPLLVTTSSYTIIT